MNNQMCDIPEEFKYEYSEPTTPESYVAQYSCNLWDRNEYGDLSTDVWGSIKHILRCQVFEKLHEQLFSGAPICITGRYVTWDDFASYNKIIQLRVQLQKVQPMNIIMPKWGPVEVYQGHKVEVKVLCAACGNVWIQSSRGACSSCGSPANWSIK